MPKGAGDWTREEEEAIVADYFSMLSRELRGEPYNKSEHRRTLMKLMPSRTDGSIEKKRQNISAVLLQLGYPYIDGYKPLPNAKTSLRTVVRTYVANASDVRSAADELVDSSIVTVPTLEDVLSILVEPPLAERNSGTLREAGPRLPRIADYAERDQRNRALGQCGEALVMRYEQARLVRAGKKKLADRIEHVSVKHGDHLGYDVHSFEESGAPRLIEVKTTRLAAMTPFYATRNEVALSDEKQEEYCLYRLYQFAKAPRLFILPGSLYQTCSLDPLSYVAYVD